MKKSIYISGIACANIMMLGCMCKIQHWPGASVLMIIATFLFCFVFLPMALMNSYKEQQKYKTLHIVTFITFFVGMVSVLFKVMHWPGAGMLLIVSIPLPFVLFLPVYIYQTASEKNNNNFNFLGVMFGLIFLAVFSVLLALNVSKDILNSFADQVAMNDNASQYNKAKAATNAQLQSAELCAYIDDLKLELLKASSSNFSGGNLNSHYAAAIENQDNTQIAIKVLYGESDKIAELKNKINAFRESLAASGRTNPELTALANSLFDVSNKTEDGNTESWEQRELSNSQLIIVLDALSQIESNAKMVESEL